MTVGFPRLDASSLPPRGRLELMPRRMFTVPSVLTLLLCAGTGAADLGTMKVGLYGLKGPDIHRETVPWLGWSCAFFAAATLGLLLRRASRIRTWDDRRRRRL